jgi:predicted DNA-binding protein (UPF0251 family)
MAFNLKDWSHLKSERSHPPLCDGNGTQLVPVTVAETMQQESIEIISLEKFAKRMGVSRTTVFEWMKKGKLLPVRAFQNRIF